MFNLFDILQAQGGGTQSLGQQFGLSPDQSRRAMEALLPALTMGLQRNAATDPAGLGRLFGLAGAETRVGGSGQPDLLLRQLFGSPALSQAVLQQAATASGIGAQALRQMLPVMAGMVVAGIVHMLLNQPPPAAPVREPDPPPTPAFAAVDFWNDWMNGMLASSGETAPAKAGPRRQRAEDTSPERAPPRVDRDAAALPAPRSGLAAEPADEERGEVPLEVFQQMFQTGIQVQEQNVKAMQDIFDSFWGDKGGAAPPVGDRRTPEEVGAGGGSEPSGAQTKKTRGGRSKPGGKAG